VGPYALENLASSGLAYSFELGRQWDVTPQATLGLDDTFVVKDTAYFEALDLGGTFYFTDDVTAPYLGLDMGYGFAGNPDLLGAHPVDTVFGFSAGARLGILFFRNSSVQLSLELRHLALFTANSVAYPQTTGLELAIHY
jgi:hypothetical protein